MSDLSLRGRQTSLRHHRARRGHDQHGVPTHLRIGMLGTYPPTECGIASFTANLRRSLLEARPAWKVPVARIVEDPIPLAASEVTASWIRGRPVTISNALEVLNECDVVVIQHEFGIFDGRDGESVVDLARELHVPLVVELHTVLSEPSLHQRAIVQYLMDRAALTVAPSASALSRLCATHRVEHAALVPHGAVANFTPRPDSDHDERRILTWGLLGPGKGIEDAIRALRDLRDLRPSVTYLIAGRTHPHERANGDLYRRSLSDLASSLGVRSMVRFDDHYHSQDELNALIRSADVVLLPYESTQQVCSGVLVEALASARPVVATRFPHAVELLSDGAGLVVEHNDPKALSAALRRVLEDPGLSARMSARARAIGESLTWPRVAELFGTLLESVVAGVPSR